MQVRGRGRSQGACRARCTGGNPLKGWMVHPVPCTLYPVPYLRAPSKRTPAPKRVRPGYAPTSLRRRAKAAWRTPVPATRRASGSGTPRISSEVKRKSSQAPPSGRHCTRSSPTRSSLPGGADWGRGGGSRALPNRAAHRPVRRETSCQAPCWSSSALSRATSRPC